MFCMFPDSKREWKKRGNRSEFHSERNYKLQKYFSSKCAGEIFREITVVRFLDGALGGVYALMLAHLPTLIMNWREMKTFFEWIVR